MTKPPPKWMQVLSPALNVAGAGVAAAGASGFGIESTLPDGTVDVSAWPTLLAGVGMILSGLITGQSNVTKAAAAPPVDDKGKSSSTLTLSVAIQQAWNEGKPDLVKSLSALAPAAIPKKPKPEEGGGS